MFFTEELSSLTNHLKIFTGFVSLEGSLKAASESSFLETVFRVFVAIIMMVYNYNESLLTT